MLKARIAVRTLVESILRSGDLSAQGSINRMLEGAEGHRLLQAEPGATNEVALSLTVQKGDVELTVHGRIDRLYEGPIIEEIKTTWREPGAFDADAYPLHWAQAYFYAHMLAQKQGLEHVAVRLCYFHLSSKSVTRFTRQKSAAELREFVDGIIERYMAFLSREDERTQRMQKELLAAPFPYGAYRKGQRELAAQVYVTLRDGGQLLFQAPTGTGKTMAALFPALKALGEGRLRRLFYLSARGTGRKAALDAVQTLGLQSLRTIELNAKAKICPWGATRCTDGNCERAIGYFDKLDAAIEDILGSKGPYAFDEISFYAQKHSVCPFEFSLDLSLLCDLILCDYNYAFDPRAKLQRFFGGGRQSQALLIDEAHNLHGRAREMYSAELSLKELDALRKSIPRGEKRKQKPYLLLRDLIKAIQGLFEDRPTPFLEEAAPPLQAQIEALLPFLSEGFEADQGLLTDCFFMLAGFLRYLNDYPAEYATLYDGAKASRRIKLYCRSAANQLAECYKKVSAAVLFSATMAPLSFYGQVSGLSQDASLLSLPSPFPPENLLCLHLPLNLRYSYREQSMPQVVEAVAQFVRSREKGNFFVFCPSFAYLRALQEQLPGILPGASIHIQRQGMDDLERAAYLELFKENGEGLTIGLAVMGGAFGEGIDLPGDRLNGAVIIGVGLPQIGAENETLRSYYDELYDGGYAYAYIYPGFCRVLQAAGRVIRSEEDRGAILLIDDRYGAEPYLSLLPDTWNMLRVRNGEQLRKRLADFW